MKKISLLPLFLLITACHSPHSNESGQPPPIVVADTLWELTGIAALDSLLQLETTALPDTNLARLYDDIGYMYAGFDHRKAKAYYIKSRNLSEALKWNEGLYLFAAGFTNILNREGLMDSSIVIHRQALELAKKEIDEARIAKILLHLGNCYNYKNWFETALKYYGDALRIFEKRGEKFNLGHIYYLMGTVYSSMNMQDENYLYCEKSLDIFNERPDTIFRAHALINFAVALNKKLEFEKAENCLLEAQRICLLHNDRYFLGDIYSNLGNIAFQQFDLEKMEKYNRLLLEIALEFDDPVDYCISYRAFGYLEKYRGDFDKAEKYAMEALKKAGEFDLPNEKWKCYALLASLSDAKNDFRTARFYHSKLDSIDVVLNFEQTRLFAKEMEAKYENEKKEIEIERQQHVIARQTMLRNLFVVSIIVLVLFLALLWNMLRMRNRRNAALSERNTALSDMNVTKDKFFNIISHDLKNPTLTLHDNLKLLVGNIRLWDADTMSEFSAELLKSAEGQVELLNSLLNWARIQTGRITCKHVTFDLVARLRSDILLVRKMADNKGVRLIFRMPDSASVTGDGNLLVTVVRNLLTNAVKFTAPDGTVTLSVEPAERSKYIVSVEDTGTGMSPELIANLFRLDKPQTNQGTAGEEGSGLGLIVCRELLIMHNSLLHVESEEGKGSRFWFTV